MKKTNKLFGDCGVCGGRVSERHVQKLCTWGGRLVAVVENVPAGVCEQCGERYYQGKVLKTIESMLATRKKIGKHLRVPNVKYAA